MESSFQDPSALTFREKKTLFSAICSSDYPTSQFGRLNNPGNGSPSPYFHKVIPGSVPEKPRLAPVRLFGGPTATVSDDSAAIRHMAAVRNHYMNKGIMEVATQTESLSPAPAQPIGIRSPSSPDIVAMLWMPEKSPNPINSASCTVDAPACAAGVSGSTPLTVVDLLRAYISEQKKTGQPVDPRLSEALLVAQTGAPFESRKAKESRAEGDTQAGLYSPYRLSTSGAAAPLPVVAVAARQVSGEVVCESLPAAPGELPCPFGSVAVATEAAEGSSSLPSEAAQLQEAVQQLRDRLRQRALALYDSNRLAATSMERSLDRLHRAARAAAAEPAAPAGLPATTATHMPIPADVSAAAGSDASLTLTALALARQRDQLTARCARLQRQCDGLLSYISMLSGNSRASLGGAVTRRTGAGTAGAAAAAAGGLQPSPSTSSQPQPCHHQQHPGEQVRVRLVLLPENDGRPSAGGATLRPHVPCRVEPLDAADEEEDQPQGAGAAVGVSDWDPDSEGPEPEPPVRVRLKLRVVRRSTLPKLLLPLALLDHVPSRQPPLSPPPPPLPPLPPLARVQVRSAATATTAAPAGAAAPEAAAGRVSAPSAFTAPATQPFGLPAAQLQLPALEEGQSGPDAAGQDPQAGAHDVVSRSWSTPAIRHLCSATDATADADEEELDSDGAAPAPDADFFPYSAHAADTRHLAGCVAGPEHGAAAGPGPGRGPRASFGGLPRGMTPPCSPRTSPASPCSPAHSQDPAGSLLGSSSAAAGVGGSGGCGVGYWEEGYCSEEYDLAESEWDELAAAAAANGPGALLSAVAFLREQLQLAHLEIVSLTTQLGNLSHQREGLRARASQHDAALQQLAFNEGEALLEAQRLRAQLASERAARARLSAQCEDLQNRLLLGLPDRPPISMQQQHHHHHNPGHPSAAMLHLFGSPTKSGLPFGGASGGRHPPVFRGVPPSQHPQPHPLHPQPQPHPQSHPRGAGLQRHRSVPRFRPGSAGMGRGLVEWPSSTAMGRCIEWSTFLSQGGAAGVLDTRVATPASCGGGAGAAREE